MKNHIVYKLLDKNDKIVWASITSIPLEDRELEHRFQLMDFEKAVQVGEPYQDKEEAEEAVSRLLKECIDRDGHLPLYVLMSACRMLPPGKRIEGRVPKGPFFPTVVDA